MRLCKAVGMFLRRGLIGCLLPAAGALATSSAWAGSANQEEPLVMLRQLTDRQDREERLLHRQVDLGEVQCWDGNGRTFMPQNAAPDRIAIINLWSIRCAPCLAEFPRLRNIVHAAKQQGLKIDFWFIADPPDETSQADALGFWRQPSVPLPDVVPCRSTGTRLRSSLGVEGVPITLLVDGKRVIRQAFMGSIEGRKVAAAMERLLAVATVKQATARPARHR